MSRCWGCRTGCHCDPFILPDSSVQCCRPVLRELWCFAVLVGLSVRKYNLIIWFPTVSPVVAVAPWWWCPCLLPCLQARVSSQYYYVSDDVLACFDTVTSRCPCWLVCKKVQTDNLVPDCQSCVGSGTTKQNGNHHIMDISSAAMPATSFPLQTWAQEFPISLLSKKCQRVPGPASRPIIMHITCESSSIPEQQDEGICITMGEWCTKGMKKSSDRLAHFTLTPLHLAVLVGLSVRKYDFRIWFPTIGPVGGGTMMPLSACLPRECHLSIVSLVGWPI